LPYRTSFEGEYRVSERHIIAENKHSPSSVFSGNLEKYKHGIYWYWKVWKAHVNTQLYSDPSKNKVFVNL